MPIVKTKCDQLMIAPSGTEFDDVNFFPKNVVLHNSTQMK